MFLVVEVSRNKFHQLSFQGPHVPILNRHRNGIESLSHHTQHHLEQRLQKRKDSPNQTGNETLTPISKVAPSFKQSIWF